MAVNVKARAKEIVANWPKTDGKSVITETIVRQIVSLVRAGEMDGGRTAENVAEQYRALTGHKYKAASVPGMVGQLKTFLEKNNIPEAEIPAEFTIVGGGKKGRRAKIVNLDLVDDLVGGLVDQLNDDDDDSESESGETA